MLSSKDNLRVSQVWVGQNSVRVGQNLARVYQGQPRLARVIHESSRAALNSNSSRIIITPIHYQGTRHTYLDINTWVSQFENINVVEPIHIWSLYKCLFSLWIIPNWAHSIHKGSNRDSRVGWVFFCIGLDFYYKIDNQIYKLNWVELCSMGT